MKYPLWQMKRQLLPAARSNRLGVPSHNGVAFCLRHGVLVALQPELQVSSLGRTATARGAVTACFKHAVELVAVLEGHMHHVWVVWVDGIKAHQT